MNIFEGKIVAEENIRIGIVIARFNSFITQHLLEGAEDGLLRQTTSMSHTSQELLKSLWPQIKWRTPENTMP